MTAQTPGQAARDAYYHPHHANGDARWEAAAQAGIDAFLAGDSVSAGSIREALAAAPAQPAPGEAPTGEPLTHFFHCWRFPDHHACAVALIERQAEENDRLSVKQALAEPKPAPECDDSGDNCPAHHPAETAPGDVAELRRTLEAIASGAQGSLDTATPLDREWVRDRALSALGWAFMPDPEDLSRVPKPDHAP